jgi:hypothetical protein
MTTTVLWRHFGSSRVESSLAEWRPGFEGAGGWQRPASQHFRVVSRWVKMVKMKRIKSPLTFLQPMHPVASDGDGDAFQGTGPVVFDHDGVR